MTISFRGGVVLICSLFSLWLALFPPGFLPSATASAASFTLVILSLWATGLIAEYLTALLFFTGAMLLGIAPAGTVFSGFSSGAFWLIFGGLVLGIGINTTGIGRRIAARVAFSLNSSYSRLVTGLVFVGVLFGLLMPSALGRVILLVPVGMTIADQFGLKPGRNGHTGIIAAVVMGSFLPGFSILPANVPNMVLAGLSETLYSYVPLYGEYLLLHFPLLGIFKSLLLVVAILLLFPDRLSASTQARPLSAPMVGREKVMAVILLTLLALWMTDFLHHVSPAWVAMAGACIILLPPVLIVSPQDFKDKINFGSLFYIAGILGLGQMINQTGLGGVLAEQCIAIMPLDPARPFFNFLSLGIMAMITGIFTTQPGIPAVLTPFAGELAAATGFSVKAVLMSQVLGFSQPIFPYQVPPLVIGMQMAGVPLAQSFKLCLLLSVAVVLLIFPLDYLWWQLWGWI